MAVHSYNTTHPLCHHGLQLADPATLATLAVNTRVLCADGGALFKARIADCNGAADGYVRAYRDRDGWSVLFTLACGGALKCDVYLLH